MIPWIAGTLFLISLGGFTAKYSKRAQMATILLALAALAPLINTGHTGGELVYKHGGSVAYLSPEHKAAIQSGTILELHEKGNHEKEERDDDH